MAVAARHSPSRITTARLRPAGPSCSSTRTCCRSSRHSHAQVMALALMMHACTSSLLFWKHFKKKPIEVYRLYRSLDDDLEPETASLAPQKFCADMSLRLVSQLSRHNVSVNTVAAENHSVAQACAAHNFSPARTSRTSPPYAPQRRLSRAGYRHLTLA